MAAELMVELANAPQRIGPRLTRGQIEATFKETHLDDQMKGFGLWDDVAEWHAGTEAVSRIRCEKQGRAALQRHVRGAVETALTRR